MEEEPRGAEAEATPNSKRNRGGGRGGGEGEGGGGEVTGGGAGVGIAGHVGGRESPLKAGASSPELGCVWSEGGGDQRAIGAEVRERCEVGVGGGDDDVDGGDDEPGENGEEK